MSAEIICVGTELLLGEIVNTNAQYLAQELAILGIPHYHQSVVGDNPDRLKQVIEIALNRSANILIFTGGLGPTPDDLTTATIADYFRTPLIEHSEVLADILQKFAQRGITMTPNNRRQALLPEGAQVLPNPSGTAPGMIWHPRSELLILTFPGVPSEMITMWQSSAVPYLKQLGWGKEVIYSHTMRFRGIGESALAAKVTNFFELQSPTVAPYASKGEVRLRISAKATSQMAAQAIIQPVAEQIKMIAGSDYFGADEDTLSSVVGHLLSQAQETLAVAESCTGGSLGEMITDTPGSSAYFVGGIIAYSNQVKMKLYGAVSEAVALEMAKGVRNKLGTTWGISITGIAGPQGETETKAVGLVYIGIAGPDFCQSMEFKFGNKRDRSIIRHLSACTALDQLRRQLIKRNAL
jgi:nicotinamide-nucleotide amidase